MINVHSRKFGNCRKKNFKKLPVILPFSLLCNIFYVIEIILYKQLCFFALCNHKYCSLCNYIFKLLSNILSYISGEHLSFLLPFAIIITAEVYVFVKSFLYFELFSYDKFLECLQLGIITCPRIFICSL